MFAELFVSRQLWAMLDRGMHVKNDGSCICAK